MQDLRLVGVHDGGEHLLLSGAGGDIYRLRIDEALRVAASRNPQRFGASGPAPANSRPRPTEPVVSMSPRDIQSRIRAGATAEEVASESGLDLARVERYEGPVQAERDHTAQQAQKVEVAAALPNNDGYRSAFGDNPASLGEMVAHRLTAFGLDSGSVDWDAWRRPDGAWDVVAHFEATSDAAAGIGEQPPAQWIFNPVRKTLHNSNRWAQVLSELEPMDGPVPARRLSAVADRVFDFEAEQDEATEAQADEDPESSSADPGNLLDVLRSRRGQRIGADEEGDDALAMMLSRGGGVPAAHPRDEEAADADASERDDSATAPALSLAPAYTAADDEGNHQLHDGVSDETSEITISGAPKQEDDVDGGSQSAVDGHDAADSHGGDGSRDGDPDAGRAAAQPAAADEDPAVSEAADRKQNKQKRSSVPSWDEIVFGTKGD
ncbi:septation protein SepH [Arthrobacter castelli]|uniref:septation protein SepH n=1 Tax=Arthrobacter castelli TaxID=271431 RepID=UPI000425A68F|nr:septation protein SepH [Arthrobacter castelli]